jgi:molybdopterin molybdotransferase
VICLSGNPFGATANFELLVRPVLARLSRNPKMNIRKKQAVLQNDFPKGGRRFLRGIYENGTACISLGNHASGTMSSMLGCNCLIEIEANQKVVQKGDLVWVHLL